MAGGLMGYNDQRRPSVKAIAEENEHMRRRQEQFRIAAQYVAHAFSQVPQVQKVVLFGSVAVPLFEEVPRFRRYRIHQVPLLHECADVDIAVWLSDASCLKNLQRARGLALNYLFDARDIGVAHHQVDTFLMDHTTDSYIGNLCYFGTCPKGKEDCRVTGCGETPFLKAYEKFRLREEALSPDKTIILYDRAGASEQQGVSEPSADNS